MGEIAEMHLDGTLCELCGEYLGKAVGYPRYCRDCWNEMSKQEKKEYLSIYQPNKKQKGIK